MLQIAVDIGGTFTDGVLLEDGSGTARIHVAKTLTTPRSPGDAIGTVVHDLLSTSGFEGAAVERVLHGTTLVANTLVERRGARVALVLTPGTMDALDIRRELRYDIYDLNAQYPDALVALEDRFELAGRLGPDGSEWQPLDAQRLREIAETLASGPYDAIAVCLLHAPVDGTHEEAAGEVLRTLAPDKPVSLSIDIAREIGEFERMCTTVANAYVQPIVRHYLSTLGARLEGHGIDGTLDIMMSNGAFTRAQLAADAPIRILESGPAGGVQSAINCGLDAGVQDVLAFDMGGTTAKACVAAGGEAELTHVFEFGRVQRFKHGSGLPAVAPSMDLIEIGAGGGSLAGISALGLLSVGPQSAGSEPGPACYGRGGADATVTDADLVLGYLDADRFLGGTMKLDTERARAALAAAGAPLGLSIEATAWGIHDIVNENMASAARTHIAEKGLDARAFTLVATGGAGPVHAVDVARRLRISHILCPVASGVGSCLGFLSAPARADRSWSKVELLSSMDGDDFRRRLAAANASIKSDLKDCGLAAEQIVWRLNAEIRYAGQGNTVEVEIADEFSDDIQQADVVKRFEDEYLRLYRKLIASGLPEVVTWRLSGSSTGGVIRFHLHGADQSASMELTNASLGSRTLYLPDQQQYASVPVFDRYKLPQSAEVSTPAVLVEPESTLIVAYPGKLRVLPGGTVEVKLAPATQTSTSDQGDC